MRTRILHRIKNPDGCLLPELRLFPERRTKKSATQRIVHSWQFYLLILTILPVALGLLPLTIRENVLPFRRSFLLATCVGACHGFGGLLLIALLYRPIARRRLRRDLNLIGIRICVACGYDLRGSHEPRCPECGTESILCEPQASLPAPILLWPSLIAVGVIAFAIAGVLFWLCL